MMYVIAETACSHNGDQTLLKEMISTASDAGADAVQLQIWEISEMVVNDHPVIGVISKVYLHRDQWRDTFAYCKSNFKKLDVIACIYGINTFNFCIENGITHFKLHASEIKNHELLRRVAQFASRVDLSIGGVTRGELERALEILSGNVEIWLMYGLQLFPTPAQDVGLKKLILLKENYQLDVGFQDHAPPIGMSLISQSAAALGAGIEIFEKHISPVRQKDWPDCQAALTFEEFSNYVAEMTDLKASFSTANLDEFSKSEDTYRTYSKRTLVYNRKINKNDKIKVEDLILLRHPKPGDLEIEPEDVKDRTLIRTVLQHEVVSMADFK